MKIEFLEQTVTATIDALKGKFTIDVPGRCLRGKLTPELAALLKKIDGEKSGGTMIVRSNLDSIDDAFKQFLRVAGMQAESSPETEDIRIASA